MPARASRPPSPKLNIRFDQVEARIDRPEGHMDSRIDRLGERDVRHLEAHATGSAP